MNRKSLKQQTYIKTGLTLGIIIVIILIINQLSFRLDLTQGNQYSLSKTSKQLMKNLDDIVNIKVYFSKELPNYLLTTRQEVSDLLKEYQNYAGSKLKIVYLDPNSNPDIEKEAQSLKIPKLQFNVLENDKYQVTNGYLGIAVSYGTNSEILPVVEDVQNFEYDLTLAIKKVMAKNQPRIAFAIGHGEKGSGNLQVLTKILESQYLLQDIDLTNGSLIPENVNTLIINGPIQPYDDRSLFIVDQFLMRGGSLLVLNDKVGVDQSLRSVPVNNNLDNLLANYGLRVNSDLVADVSNEMANFTQGFVQFFVPYPLWVKVLPQGFDKNNVMVSQLESLVLPWSSSVEYLGNQTGKEVSYLVKTTNKAWTQTGNYVLDPQKQQETFNQQNQGQKNLAIAVFGPQASYFKGKDAPQANIKQTEAEAKLDQTEWARIIIMGNSDFNDDGFLQSFNGNAVYMQNIIDGLTQDADLINIRSKEITDRALKELSNSQRLTIKYLVIFGPTVLLVVYGLLRFFMRRRKSFIDEL